MIKKLTSKKAAQPRLFGPKNPRLLLHPNIPKPLHGIAPRVILGKEWWDRARQKAYAAANYCCQACGVPKELADEKPWLEAHEIYDMDYETGQVVYKHCVALCYYCHNYIHDGRMKMLVRDGEMTPRKMDRILRHGDRLSKGIPDSSPTSTEVPWEDWRMWVNGEAYGPSTRSYAEWSEGKWREWKPPEQ